jgi:hypothetical protein
VRGGRVGGAPFAVDDDYSDLALTFAERVVAGMEMPAERRRDLRQLGIVYPDFVGAAQRAARLTAKL